MVKLVQGVIQRISIKPIANGPDRFENNFRRSFQVDDVWYSMGGCKTDKWNVKIGNDFKVLGVGSTVAFKAEQSGDFWNGKSLMVLELVEGSDTKPTQQTSSGDKPAYTPKPRNDAGIQLGHSVNGAMNFLITWGVEASNENIISYGKKVHGATEKLKKEHKEANPEMSDYDASASVGNAILNACKLVGTETDFEQGVYEIAKDLLENVVKPLGEFIRSPKESAQQAKVTRSAPTKKAVTKAKPVVEEALPDIDESEDLDSQLPF